MPQNCEDESDVVRPRWIGWAIRVGMALVVLGLVHVGWRIMQP